MQEDMRLTLPAAEPEPEHGAWTLGRASVPRIGDLLRLSDGHEVIEYALPEGTSYDTMKEGLHILIGRLRDGTVPTCATPRLRERLNEIIDERRASQIQALTQPIAPPATKVTMVDVLPVSSDSPVYGLKQAGPVYTVALVDGRMTVFRDGEPAPESPWQHVMDAQQNEADRVMVRYVDAEEVDLGDVWVWVLDRGPTAHHAPFAEGDLVMRARGRHGVHVVLGVEDDVDGMIRLRVKDTVPVIDRDAF